MNKWQEQILSLPNNLPPMNGKQNLPIYYCKVTVSIKSNARVPAYPKTFNTTLTYDKEHLYPINDPLRSYAIKEHIPSAKSSTSTIIKIEKIKYMGNTAY